MPIKPKTGEDKDTFIARCISTEIKSGKPRATAIGICYSVWKNK